MTLFWSVSTSVEMDEFIKIPKSARATMSRSELIHFNALVCRYYMLGIEAVRTRKEVERIIKGKTKPVRMDGQ